MKKKVAIVLVAVTMLLSACSGTATSSKEADTSSEAVTSSVETSTEASSQAVSETSSVESSTASTSSVSSATSVASTTSTVSKTSTTASSKATSSKATSSKASSTATGMRMDSNPTSARPKKLEMCITGFMGESTDNPDQKEKWTKTMSERYGVDISVTLPPKADVTTFLTTHIAAGDLKGMVYRYSPDDVIQAIYEGYIIPIDEYLKDNATWNALPEAMKNNYKIDGKIWAVPNKLTGYGTGVMWSRYFRRDWLNALGLAVPKTFEETKNAVTLFATKDPDGSGINSDNVGITFGGEWTWRDLFAAQDALTYEQGLNIGYHPETNAYEDSFLRPGAKSVFEFFRYVYTNGYCDATAFTSGFTDLRTKLNSGIVGSTFFYGNQGKYTWGPAVYNLILRKTENRKADYDKYPEDWTKATTMYAEVSMITGTRTKNTWFMTTDGGPWTLMKGTAQPKETVNFFVDLMYSSETTFLESYWNLKDYWTKNSDGTFTRFYKDAANKVGYASASLNGFIEPSMYPYKIYAQAYAPDVTPAGKQRTKETVESNASRDAAALANGQLYTIKAEYKTVRSTTYRKYYGDVTNYASQLIVACATNKNITVDKAMADYKKNMAAIGGDKMLAEANAAFGLKNDYQSYNK